MAELKTDQSIFRLTPLALEFPGEEWIRSELSLRLIVNRQAVLVKPQSVPTLSRRSYRQLVTGARNFLDSCAAGDDDIFDDREPFVFVPTELDFEFALLDGDISENGEGEVTVRVMIRMERNKSAYVGGTLSVDVSQFRRFLNTLEAEIEQMVYQKASSAFVTAEV
ncbi:MAG: hypothetical protein KJZ86_03380 [Caldilineaceae bacterium]|nr:hypothetical protein [Caldilineaceae bacterium]HRJ42052.1 hypothetical protein [Caldilineaceae bacterium]